MPKTVFSVDAPKFLWISDTLPEKGGTPKKVPITEAEKLFSFSYTESLLSSLPSLTSLGLNDTSRELTKSLKAYAKNAPEMIDKLVICPMEGNLGWGVFARVDIPEQTLVAIYAGSIEKKDDVFSPYNLDSGDTYHTAAEKIGGIARFFQHAPFNPEEWAEELSRSTTNIKLRKAIALYEGKTGEDLNFTPSQLHYVPPLAFLEMLRQRKPQEREMLLRLSDFDSLKFDTSTTRNNLAWENLKSLHAVVDGVPLRIFVSNRLIRKHEIITFCYGPGYWVAQGVYPELFTRNGCLLSRSTYQRTIVPFSLSSIVNRENKIFLYPSKIFLDYDASTQRPVAISPAADLISSFLLRQELVRANAISQKFDRLEDNSFVADLRNTIKSLNPNIKAFYRLPNASALDAHIVDVVCTFPDLSRWIYFTKISRSHFGRTRIKAFQSTKEIIFSDVNNPDSSEKIMSFIEKLPQLLKTTPLTTPQELADIKRETPNSIFYFWSQQNPHDRFVIQEDREVAETQARVLRK